jgi:hypothetical protein
MDNEIKCVYQYLSLYTDFILGIINSQTYYKRQSWVYVSGILNFAKNKNVKIHQLYIGKDV